MITFFFHVTWVRTTNSVWVQCRQLYFLMTIQSEGVIVLIDFYICIFHSCEFTMRGRKMRKFMLRILMLLHELRISICVRQSPCYLMMKGYTGDHIHVYDFLCDWSPPQLMSLSWADVRRSWLQLLLPLYFKMLYVRIETIHTDHEDFFSDPFFFELLLLDGVLHIFVAIFNA